MGLVVRSPNWLGDAVMCLPAVDALSSEFGKITIVAKKSAIPVFQKYDCIECKGSMDTAALKLAKEKSGSDSIVLFTNSFTTALAA
ncbi:MAG: hypothetical protein JKX97_08180, partial [Candidatus Lindowbacteria bacterium]|nr:hypothetical protein [Candidatus Lindowbacteria bacterium]